MHKMIERYFISYNTFDLPAAYRNYDGCISAYDGCILEYASGIPELRRLHNSRMVYTKHPVWYIPYGSFAIYQRGTACFFIKALRVRIYN
jgi:hypothetical protein